MIFLTRHAQERVETGEVARSWIDEAIAAPDRRTLDLKRPGITLSFKRVAEFGNRVLRVAHRPQGTDVIIITAFFDRGATS